MDYNRFKEILNKHIFGETTLDLLKNLANKPERFIGLFRPSKPKTKIIQHILQSREIKFGDAMEEIISEILKDKKYIVKEGKDKKIAEGLEADQLFEDTKGNIYLIEQKVRDDHDSTKRVGQFNNFKEKVKLLYSKFKEKTIAYMYFIDPSMKKNEKYYLEQIKNLQEECKIKEIGLLYGEDFFKKFFLSINWPTLLNWLKKWKEELPELPELNLEKEINMINLSEKRIEKYIQKIINNEKLWKEGIIKVLFPTGDIWKDLIEKYQSEKNKKGGLFEVKETLAKYINKYYAQ